MCVYVCPHACMCNDLGVGGGGQGWNRFRMGVGKGVGWGGVWLSWQGDLLKI